MIPTLANIRKAIYCLNKRLDLLEGGEYSSTVTQLSNKVAALESLLDDDAQNPTAAIDKFNEIVAFLSSIDNTETLQELLRDVIQQSYQQNYVTVLTYSNLPVTGSIDTIYRVANYNGSTNQVDSASYSEYTWDGTNYTLLCVKNQIGEVFDISAYHATGGVLTKYADLAAALDSNNGGGVPESLQKGGMSVKFVQSSDNKYVQYRCIANQFSTTPSDWQGIEDKPAPGSHNYVKGGGIDEYALSLAYDNLRNYQFGRGDLKKIVYSTSTNTYQALDNFGSIVVPIRKKDTISALTYSESPLLTVYIDANEPIIDGEKNELDHTPLNYINGTDNTVWLVVSFRTNNDALIECSVSINKYSYFDDFKDNVLNNLSREEEFIGILPLMFERGSIRSNTGLPYYTNITIRTYFIKVISGEIIKIINPNNFRIAVYKYGNDKDFIGVNYVTENTYTVPSDTYFIKVMLYKQDSSEILISEAEGFTMYIDDSYLGNKITLLESQTSNADKNFRTSLDRDKTVTGSLSFILERGSLYATTGLPYDTIITLRTGFIEVVAASILKIINPKNLKVAVYKYESDETYIGVNYLTGTEITYSVPEDVDLIRVLIYKQDSSSIDIYEAGGFSVITDNSYLGNKINQLAHNEWSGKKLLCLGDSITDVGNYVRPLANILGTVTYNRGWSNTCLTKTAGGTAVGKKSIAERVDDTPNDSLEDTTSVHHSGYPTSADLITIFAGINDWFYLPPSPDGYDISVGNVTDAPDVDGSFCAAMHYLMQRLKERYPTAKIVVLLVYRVKSYKFPSSSEINFNDDGIDGKTQAEIEASGFNFITKRSTNTTLDDLRDCMAEIATMYGAEVVDLRKVGFSYFWNADREAYSTLSNGVYDGLHPNVAGGEIMADYIAKHILNT